MTLKTELKQFKKPLIGMRRYQMKTHVFIYQETEESHSEFFLCFGDEVEDMFNYLQTKVVAVRVLALGEEVARYWKED